jgi:hypothetical protein
VKLVERATREHVPLITAKATTEGPARTILPLPQYGMRAPDISGYEMAGESFRRDIQNALGRYSVQDHRLGSTKVTSGVALRELDKSGDLGSYHFVAHYDDIIRELASQAERTAAVLRRHRQRDRHAAAGRHDQARAGQRDDRPRADGNRRMAGRSAVRSGASAHGHDLHRPELRQPARAGQRCGDDAAR